MPKLPTPADLDLIVYDFDGVMTDNRVLVLQDGTEGVFCNRGDGLGVGMIRRAGVPQIILSTEENPVVAARAAKLKLHCIHGCKDKAQALAEYAAGEGIDLSRTLFVGNDVNDLGVMRSVGWPVCPADAHADILAMARVATAARGGFGVIRELADLLGAGRED